MAVSSGILQPREAELGVDDLANSLDYILNVKVGKMFFFSSPHLNPAHFLLLYPHRPPSDVLLHLDLVLPLMSSFFIVLNVAFNLDHVVLRLVLHFTVVFTP